MTYIENKNCTMYLGVHIVEQALSLVFDDVEVMPLGNKGYDVICNHGKLVDIKSSCTHKDGNWSFSTKCNQIADYFLCLAFNNREDLTLLHAWLLPRQLFPQSGLSINPRTLEKWDMFEIDISKIASCCEQIVETNTRIRKYTGTDDNVGSPLTIDRNHRKTRLVEYIRNHYLEMRPTKLIALFCIEEMISMATVKVYLAELIKENRIEQVDRILQVVKR